MKTKLVSFVLLSAAATLSVARAQPAEVVTPTPMAPPAASATAPVTSPTPNQVVYAARLPSVNELTNIGTAQGLTVDRVVQTANQITVTYKSANGQTNTVAYQLLAGNTTASAPTPVYAPAAAPSTPAPAVVYYEAVPRVYYDGYGPGYYYDRGYWYPPVSLSLGFGFRGGGFRGGYYGGFRHWR